MRGFALLWAKILDSSIWMESKETRLVWITMLAMKDSEGVVMASPKALAWRARVSDGECEEALRVLSGPDRDRPGQEHEGRRIEVVEGGWRIINADKYRFSTEAKREFWRKQKAEQRQKGKRGRQRRQSEVQKDNEARERRAVAAAERGDEVGAERIAAGDEIGA